MMTSPTIRVGPFRWQCSAPGSSGAVSRSGPCRRISLASRLPSPPSALSVLSLFGSFVGTMHLLDSLPPCMKGLPLRVPLPARCPAALGQWQGLSVLARPEGTRFLCMRGVFDSAGSAAHSRFLCTAVWPSDGLTPWASWITVFGAQYPAYRYPCPTLQVQPHDCPRMARGQGGSLFLPCTTLAFATPRRFIPTLSQTWGLPHKFCNIPDVGELNGISQHWLSHFCVTALDTYRTTRWPASAPADALRGKSHSG